MVFIHHRQLSSAKWQPFCLGLSKLILVYGVWKTDVTCLMTSQNVWLTKISKAKLLFLTHWGRVTYICISKLTIIGSDNGLLPGWRQAIIWTNPGRLLIRNLWTNFNEISSEIHTFSFKKMQSKMLSAKWQPFCLSLNVLSVRNY